MKDNKDDKLDNKKRKIEFRWWNKLYNKMFYSYKELYDFIEDMEENNEESFDKDEGFWKDEIYTYNYALNLDFDIEENSNCVPMQFTGLCDKNGKKIYEGDVVKFIDYDSYNEGFENAGVVKYGGNMFYVTNRYSLNMEDLVDELEGSMYCEVISNIYDDPEMWEEYDEKPNN